MWFAKRLACEEVSGVNRLFVTYSSVDSSAFSSGSPMLISIFWNALAGIMSGLSFAIWTKAGSRASMSGFSGIPQFSRQSAALGSNPACLSMGTNISRSTVRLVKRWRLITCRSATSMVALALASVKPRVVNSLEMGV